MNKCESFSGRRARWILLGVILQGAILQEPARADGWHNAALATSSLDDWLRDIKAVVPDLDNRLKRAGLRGGANLEDLKKKNQGGGPDDGAPRAGGKLQNALTAQEQAVLARKANDCLEVLAYMKNENIFPSEFPMFPLGRMTEYRQTAKQLLEVMGPAGASAVANQVRSHLMGAGPNASDVTFHADYFKELMASLAFHVSAGNLSSEDVESLFEASAGKKPPPLQGLATRTQATLLDGADLASLLRWSRELKDTRLQAMARNQFRDRLATATSQDLEKILLDPDVDDQFKKLAGAEVRKQLPALTVGGLLALLSTDLDPSLKGAVDQELASRNPKYAEVQGEIAVIARFSTAEQPRVAEYAKWHLANAFLRAPLGQAFEWLSKGDASLRAVIWQQLEARIAAADASRRASYRDVVLTVAKDASQSMGVRRAALEFGGRLRDRALVRPLVEELSLLPRELWPAAGKTLQEITGQALGPRMGDGAAEVGFAVKKWRLWMEQNGL